MLCNLGESMAPTLRSRVCVVKSRGALDLSNRMTSICGITSVEQNEPYYSSCGTFCPSLYASSLIFVSVTFTWNGRWTDRTRVTSSSPVNTVPTSKCRLLPRWYIPRWWLQLRAEECHFLFYVESSLVWEINKKVTVAGKLYCIPSRFRNFSEMNNG